MNIKDLFSNPGAKKIQGSVTSDEMTKNVESQEYVEAKRTEFEQFVPPIDFVSASNFAKFGSAELYYEKAFERIHQYYPYDGTLAEKTEFHNSSSYLDKHVFDNLYPRTNGYMNFNGTNQYITVFGGPHTASAGMEGKTLESTFENSMVYNESKKRTSAFEFRGDDGVTVEFWLKVPNAASNRTIMHVTGAGAGEIKLTLRTGDTLQASIGTNLLATQNIDVMTNANGVFDTWNHFAVTIKSSSAGMVFDSYKNGQHHTNTVQSTAAFNMSSILPVSDGLNMTIGSNDTPSDYITGSLDEFRFWKTARTAEAIFNTWFIPVGGGTNKYDSNINLGLYFKFNEGVTTDVDLDRFVLDYSGRINNGRIPNYISSMRNTGSAITEKLLEPEHLEPIIYSTHPDVVAKKAEYKTSGSMADQENSSLLLSYFPTWMQEEDEQSGKQLKYLAQVMGSYFDTLWHQINFVNKIHDNHYISGSNKALPFAKNLLYDRGFVIPDLFVDATITENLLKKDDNEVYEKQINEVRNTIYHNLYSNLGTISKSKGTEKSFRNFFRSLGIGQDVVKLRMYADDSTFVLRNNYENKSYERKYLNFNYEGHFDATVYQTSSINNSSAHLPGDGDHSGSFTLETEIILPKKNRNRETGYLLFTGLTASVAGFHTSGSHPTPYTYPGSDLDLSIYVLKDNLDSAISPDDSQSVRFMIKGGFGELVSDTYTYQYENNKWNLAVRLKHENYPYGNVTGNIENNYVVEFYGVEADGNTKRNSFSLSSTIGGDYFRSHKIFYAGAHRQNFVGSSTYDTDIKLGYVRYWHSNLSNDAIDQHAFDSETFGANEPYESDLVNTYPSEIPREKTLAFHWAFNNLTTSDGSGELVIPDLSSGSAADNYGSLSNIIDRVVEGRAIGFNADSTNALDKIYIQTARKRLPDDLMSSDLTTIKSNETEQFFVDDDVSDNFYSFEKSMYGAISDEMMNMFSTALDLNNLIGQPNQKYHHRYNLADFLRDRFYDDVENEPDLEKFTSFYKWIDDSISIALQQLTPASARFSEKINNVIESHVLERNKYVHQVPIVTTFQSTEGSIKGISEMKYDWKHGHAPLFPDEEQTNALWQRERKVKTSEVSDLRETLRTSRNNHSIQSSGLIRREIDGSTRISDVYAVRKFAKTYDLTMVSQPSIHGGVNFGKRKNIQLFHEAIAPAGELGATSEAPQNIITVGVGDSDGLVRTTRDNDNSPRKKKLNSHAKIGKLDGVEYGSEVYGNTILPLNLMSGTVHTGFNLEVKTNFAADVVLSNLHHDTVGNYNEIPMQGPFTEAHIGGLQYRHIDINKYGASKTHQVYTQTGGTFPTASIEFVPSILLTKFQEGTGSSVTIRDGDGTIITALYSNVFDLYDNQWTNMDELDFIINNKLDMTTNKVSNNFLELTQSVTGNFYAYAIQTSAHGLITGSGFGGGSSLTFTAHSVNVDGPENRPEGWGLVFKDHPSQGDSDGAFGFVGADYNTPYPSSIKLKATRYREETAKRPVNVKNIKTLSGSQKAGNYSNEIQIFSVSPTHQKTWAKRANDDPNLDILPPSIATSLPHTTHYQTLAGVAPESTGNVFGTHQNNRQPDGLLLSPAIPGVLATGSFVVTGSPSAPTAATGSFFLTSSPSPPLAPGDAKFDLFGIETVTEASALVLTKSAGGGVQFTFEVDLDSSVVNAGYTSISGATDTLFWNDMSSSLSSSLSPDYTISYVPSEATRSIAVSMSAERPSRLNSNTITAGGGGTAGYGISFYLYFDAFGDDRTKTIYEARNVSVNATTKNITIESGSLVFESVWRDNSGGGDEFTDTFKINNFTSSYNQSLNHFSFSHSGTMGRSDQLICYINGVSSSALLPHSMAVNKFGASVGSLSHVDLATTEITLFAKNDGTNSLFTAGSTGPIYLDEVVVYPEKRPHDDMVELYNGGKWQSSKPGSPTMIMDFEGLTVGTAITNAQIIQDAGTNNNDLTASINTAGDLVPLTSSGGSITILKTPSSASFTISNAPVGADFNIVVNLESPLNSFTNIQSAAGGVNYGASYGIVDGDKLTLSGSGDVKNFFLTSSSPGDSAPNFYIELTGTGDQIHTSLRDKMNAQGLTTATFNSGSEKAFFMITASTAGPTGNDLDLAEVGTSITSIIGLSGALGSGSTGGIQDGNRLQYDTAGTLKNFIFSYTLQSDSSPNHYVMTTGSSTEIWTALKNKVETITGDTVNVNASPVTEAIFSITASAFGPSGNKTLGETGTSISSVLGMLGGVTPVPTIYSPFDNTITRPRTDLTSSERNINTRFSAPGGIEIQTIGYLDAYTQTFSAHNAMPFRNLSVLGSGSGESATIRVEDHLGQRRGLKTLRALHMGRFGIDPTYGTITTAGYPGSGSFNKQHRNRARAYNYSSGELIITGSNYDNMYINSPIPRSEFQYSWVHAAGSGSNWLDDQPILGYAPRDGIVSASLGYAEAIVFATGSTIIGS